MRKVLSFVLVLALVLGSFSMAFADNHMFSDMTGEASSEAVDVLQGLGVVAGYPDGTFRPDQIVTRAEMARFIVAALGLEQFAVGTTSKYSDMGQAPWAQGYVAYGTSLGFISGYPDGTFKPNQQVSFQEAASMLVRALGYTEAYLPGGWPAEWMIKANSLGMFDDVTMASGAAGADRGSIALMLYNALELKIGQVDNENVWNAFTPDDTMLIRLGAEFIAAADADNMGIISGDEDSVINLRAYVGAYADRYVNDDDEIIKVLPVSTFLVGDFDVSVSTIAAFSTGVEFESDMGDYDVTATVTAAGVAYFMNGEEVDPFVATAGKVYKIAVKTSGVKITNVYSVSEWVVDDSFKYSVGDLEDDNIAGYMFTLDNNDDIDMMSFELVGVDKLADIAKDNVVYVYLNSSDKVTKIEVGTEVVTGEVTKISSDSKTVTVAGKAYKYASDEVKDVVGATANTVASLEDDVTLRLDSNGFIYELKVNSATGDSYAVILETEDAGLGLSGGDALVNLFLADGTAKVFDVDADLDVTGVIIDGEWTTTYAGVTGAGTVVEYGLDADGAVDYLKVLGMTASGGDKKLTTYYNGVPVASGAVLFTYDGGTMSSKDSYDVTTVASATGTEFTADYYAKDNKILVMLIDGDITGTDLVYGVVTSWAQDLASSTDYTVTMLIDGASKTFDVKKSVYDGALALTPAAVKAMLYEVTTDGSDVVTALTDVTAGSADIAVLGTPGDGTYVNGAFNGTTIDGDAVAYMMKTGKTTFEVVSITKSNLEGASKTVHLFDVDEDLVADLVLIFE